MTREEAIEVLRRLPYGLMDLSCEQKSDLTEALNIALAALRGPTREQMEKVWRGEWIWDTSGLYPKPVCSKCGEEPYRRSNHTSDLPNYCPKCGAPMTDKAVKITLRRLEALHENNR